MGTQGYVSLPPHKTPFISQQGLLVSVAAHPELRLVAHLSLSSQPSITKLPPPLTLFSFQQRTHKPTNAPHKQARAHTRAHTHTHTPFSPVLPFPLSLLLYMYQTRAIQSERTHIHYSHPSFTRQSGTHRAHRTRRKNVVFYFSLSVSLCLSLRCLTQSLTQCVSSRTTLCFCSFCHFTPCFFLSHLFLFSLFLSSLSLSPPLTLSLFLSFLLLFLSFHSQSSFSRLP